MSFTEKLKLGQQEYELTCSINEANTLFFKLLHTQTNDRYELSIPEKDKGNYQLIKIAGLQSFFGFAKTACNNKQIILQKMGHPDAIGLMIAIDQTYKQQLVLKKTKVQQVP